MQRWNGIKDLKLLFKKGIVLGERTLVEVTLWAVSDHLIGASLRRARIAISHPCGRSHKAPRKWVQKIGGYLKKATA